MITKRIALSFVAAFVAIAGLSTFMPVYADTSGSGSQTQPRMSRDREGKGMWGNGGDMKPAVVGKVTSISGTTLAVTGKQGFSSTTPETSFTVDASSATVRKGNATSTVSAIAVGDAVMVRGTVSGSTVTATSIFDGLPAQGQGMHKPGEERDASSTPPIAGNGQPVVAGTVSSVSGSTVVMTTKAGASYSIDASSAKIVSGKDVVALSDLKTGDSIVVQGSVSGSSVSASSLIVEKASTSGDSGHPGFFGGIGRFFSQLFGF